ncbi:hypothetical protein MZM54_01430 [[Brevibacterium] frigoritolerans]|nr:hypothetical protein [Peribacillus frigoritolerans]
MEKQSIINLAVQLFNEHKHLKDEAYSVEDCLIISMEKHNTPNTNSIEFNKLFKEVYDAI